MKNRFFFILFILSLFNQLSFGSDRQLGFMGRLEWSEKGLEKTLQFALDKGLPFLESLLVDHPLPDRLLKPIRPDPNKCRADQLQHMWAETVWKECWGVPEWLLTSWTDFFLGNFMKSHRPRPSSIQLSNMVFKSLKSKSAVVKCEKNDCKIHLVVESLNLQMNADIFDLNTGEKLMNVKDMMVRLRSGLNGVFPSLVLPFHLDSSKSGLDRLIFDEEHVAVDFPQGSFAVGFASDKDPVHYNAGGLFTASDKSKYDHQRVNFDQEKDFHLFLNLANMINQSLSYNQTFVFYVKKIFLHLFKKKALIELKQLFAKIFEPKNFFLPDMRIQHYVDDTKIHLTFDALMQNLVTLINFSASSHASCEVKAYKKEYLLMQEHLKDLLEIIESSPREDHILLFDQLIGQFKKMYQMSKRYKKNCTHHLKKDFFMSKEESNFFYQKMIHLKNNLLQMVQSKKIPLMVHLGPLDGIYGNAPLGAVLKTDMFPHLKVVTDTIPNIADESFDISLQLSIDFINEVLNSAYLNSQLHFCINLSKKNRTCANGTDDMWVYFNQAPKISWDQNIKKYVLVADGIKSKLKLFGSDGLMTIKLTEHPYINISFVIEPHPDGVLIHPDFTASAIRSKGKNKVLRWLKVIKSIISIHPVAAHLVLGLKVEKNFEESMSRVFPTPDLKIGDSFMLPKIRLIRTESYPDFLKFYASFTL